MRTASAVGSCPWLRKRPDVGVGGAVHNSTDGAEGIVFGFCEGVFGNGIVLLSVFQIYF